MTEKSTPDGQDAAPVLRLVPPTPPTWVGEVLGAEAHEAGEVEKEGVLVRTRHATDLGGGELLFVRVEVPEAAGLEDDAFRTAVRRSYVNLGEVLQSCELRALRIWNYIPSIRRPSDSGFTRYEIFNEGRKQGYQDCYGESDRSGQVSSSGVGHRGDDFVLHVLASSRVAVPLENPRQRPAFRYSARYGPAAPCFSRAARLDGGLPSMRWGALGLVAGTASIVGEVSQHVGDLDAQIRETCLNLAAIGAEVAGGARADGKSPEALGDDASRAALARYLELRVYVVNEADAGKVEAEMSRWLPNLRRLDLAAVDLCRPDLLVEAEGLVRCDPR